MFGDGAKVVAARNRRAYCVARYLVRGRSDMGLGIGVHSDLLSFQEPG